MRACARVVEWGKKGALQGRNWGRGEVAQYCMRLCMLVMCGEMDYESYNSACLRPRSCETYPVKQAYNLYYVLGKE